MAPGCWEHLNLVSFLFSLCVYKPPGFCLVPEPGPPRKEDDAWVQRGWETSAPNTRPPPPSPAQRLVTVSSHSSDSSGLAYEPEKPPPHPPASSFHPRQLTPSSLQSRAVPLGPHMARFSFTSCFLPAASVRGVLLFSPSSEMHGVCSLPHREFPLSDFPGKEGSFSITPPGPRVRSSPKTQQPGPASTEKASGRRTGLPTARSDASVCLLYHLCVPRLV